MNELILLIVSILPIFLLGMYIYKKDKNIFYMFNLCKLLLFISRFKDILYLINKWKTIRKIQSSL